MVKTIFVILVILLIQPLSAFAGADKDDKLPVFVSIQPIAFFVERIGGKRVEVQELVKPG